MADAHRPIQTALYETLTAMSPSYPVYDHVPDDAAFPYLVIGPARAVIFDDKTTLGQEYTLSVTAWSRYRGRREVKLMLADVYAVLHEQSLSVAGFEHIYTRFAFGETGTSRDGLSRFGRSQFTVIVTDTFVAPAAPAAHGYASINALLGIMPG